MKDEDKSTSELLSELAALRERLSRLEAREVELERAESALRESESRQQSLIFPGFQEGFRNILFPYPESGSNPPASQIAAERRAPASSTDNRDVHELLSPNFRSVPARSLRIFPRC